jgi:hypothetical protein
MSKVMGVDEKELDIVNNARFSSRPTRLFQFSVDLELLPASDAIF